MTKAIEESHELGLARGVPLRGARRPVLLHYAIAPREDNDPKLFRVRLASSEEALPVFTSKRSALEFVDSNDLGWRVREYSPGELVSTLLGPCTEVKWVLLDPLPEDLATANDPTNLMHWERFVDYLLA